jgi:hypothetical protein
MVIGHFLVIGSGAIFDPRSGEHFNVFTRWVSDFAAKFPEGLLIKLSIALFCLALADFFRAIINHFSTHPLASILKFCWLLLATAMIGGLALVVIFDMTPPQFRQTGIIERLLDGKGTHVEIPRSSFDWAMRGHHQLGFLMFVVGFFLSAISLAWLEWRAGMRDNLPTTVYLLLLSLVFAAWLFFTQSSLAGIPQRALLLLMFIWVLRNYSAITATSNPHALQRTAPPVTAGAISDPDPSRPSRLSS